MCIRRREVERLFVHGHAAMADVVALGNAPVMPDQAAVACIHSPHVIRGTKIQDAVHFERSGFEHAPRSAKNPRQRERPYISGVDLVQRAVASSGIIAVVRRPDFGRRLQ